MVADVGAGVLLEKPVAPGLCDTVTQFAGYFNVTTATKKYFYWFFESRAKPATDPLVLWMTGGPGCSSGIALFNENGPCAVEMSGMATRKNKFSWNSNARYLHQPNPKPQTLNPKPCMGAHPCMCTLDEWQRRGRWYGCPYAVNSCTRI